jgi:GNAT superfamily N-acetyltransferase
VEIRAATKNDAHYLFDIDLKCFDFPWTLPEWRVFGQTCLGTVATDKGIPVGMALFKPGEDSLELVKIAVKHECRRQGIGRALIHNCLQYAKDTNLQTVSMVVPETLLRPGDPDDISGWAIAVGFMPETPLLRGHFELYGKQEDGVRFNLPTRSSHVS